MGGKWSGNLWGMGGDLEKLMIRIVLYSQDEKLQTLLASALNREYSVDLESRPDVLAKRISDQAFDVLIFDFDSNYRRA